MTSALFCDEGHPGQTQNQAEVHLDSWGQGLGAIARALQDAREARVAFQADRDGRDLEDRRDRRRRSPGGCFGLTERMTNHIAQPFCVSAKSARDFCVGFYFNTY